MIRQALDSEVAELVANTLPSLAVVGEHSSYGTGIVWDASGLVVTNHHVARSDRPRVTLSDGRELLGRVVARDRRNDLALISVQASGLVPAEIGQSSMPRLGQLVLALGHPLGIKDSVVLGIVSGLSNSSWMGQHGRQLLQLDIQLSPGNSGGPILDVEGQVLGVACMVASPGIALVVPTHLVSEFVAHVSRRNVA